MISEKAFASRFSTFWRETMPNLESLVRTLNLGGYDRVFRPLGSSELSHRRDLISETGFRLFGLCYPSAPAEHFVTEAALRASEYLDFHHRLPLNNLEQAEVIEINRRLTQYTEGIPGGLEFMPHLAGHGMIGECYADLVVGETLVEVKYVDRSFRSTDFRQLLCYCGLRHFMGGGDYVYAALFNPLRGTAILIEVEELVVQASGRLPSELYLDMSYVLSSGEISR
jgi:hypothetical protein